MKIKLSTFILCILLTIACITIVVMAIVMAAKDNNAEVELANDQVTEEKVDNKYVIEKSITLKNKELKISIGEEINSIDKFDGITYKNVTSKIFLNGKEIGQYKNTSIPQYQMSGTYNYSKMLRLDFFMGGQTGEEEYVVATFNQPTLVGDNIYYIIIDAQENVIGSILANKIKDIKIRTEDGIIGPDNSWKLGDESIIFYDKIDEITSKHKAAKYLVTVEEFKLKVEIQRYYTDSDLVKDI